MEMSAEKSKVVRISREPSPVEVVLDQKQLENVDYFNYLGSMMMNDEWLTWEFKSRITMKSSIWQEEDSFHQKTGLKFKEETSEVLRLKLCIVWYWKLDTSESRSEILVNFWNVLLEKDGTVQLDQSWEMRKYYIESMRRAVSCIQ